MSKNKDSQIFEYVFTKKELKNRMWSYVLMYIGLRIIRGIMYVSLGWYAGSLLAAILLFLSGIVFGMAIITIIYYRRATPIKGLTIDL